MAAIRCSRRDSCSSQTSFAFNMLTTKGQELCPNCFAPLPSVAAVCGAVCTLEALEALSEFQDESGAFPDGVYGYSIGAFGRDCCCLSDAAWPRSRR
jgi:hypothetical protein